MVGKTGGGNPFDVAAKPAFQTLAVNIPGIVYRVHTREGNRMEFFNDIVEKMTGFKTDELRRGDVCSIDPIIVPGDQPRVIEIVKDAVVENKPFEVEYRITNKNGGIRYFFERGQPIYGSDGKPEFIDGVILDITDKKSSEMALLFKENIINSSSSVIATCGLEGNMTYGNPSFLKAWGFDDPKEFIGRPFWEFWLVKDRLDEIVQALRGDGYWFGEIKAKRKDGGIFDVQVSAATVFDSGGHPIALTSTSTDITERKRAEEALQESEERLRLAVETARLAIWDWDVTEDMVRWDDPCETLFYGPVKKESAYEWWTEHIHPEDRDAVLSKFDDGMSDGKEFLVMEYRFLCPDGDWADLYDCCHIMRDKSGQPFRVVGAVMDVTGLRRAERELRQARDELEMRVKERTAELELKNKELQDFAFVASHDLAEPLRKVETFGKMLADRCARSTFDEVCKDYLKRMQNATGRMQNLLNSLLLYSRVTTKAEPLKKTDLNKSIEEALSNLEMVIRAKNAEVETGDLPTVEADRAQMIQLFQNLIGNALKFSRKEKPPHIKIYAQEVKDAFEIHVKDNGIGFEEKYLNKIFLPFQRLHGRSSEYEGEGMGLAICRKIVERNGGKITAKSELGKGSTFIVTLSASRKVR